MVLVDPVDRDVGRRAVAGQRDVGGRLVAAVAAAGVAGGGVEHGDEAGTAAGGDRRDVERVGERVDRDRERGSAGLAERGRARAAALAGRVARAVVEDRDRATGIGDVDGVARSVDGDRGRVGPREDGRRRGGAAGRAPRVAAPGVDQGDAGGTGHVHRRVRRVGRWRSGGTAAVPGHRGSPPPARAAGSRARRARSIATRRSPTPCCRARWPCRASAWSGPAPRTRGSSRCGSRAARASRMRRDGGRCSGRCRSPAGRRPCGR